MGDGGGGVWLMGGGAGAGEGGRLWGGEEEGDGWGDWEEGWGEWGDCLGVGSGGAAVRGRMVCTALLDTWSTGF